MAASTGRGTGDQTESTIDALIQRVAHVPDISPRENIERAVRRRLGEWLPGGLHKYQLNGVLGIGGMAVVYKATTENKADFAVKMLLKRYNDRDDVRERFRREGNVETFHPGVVRVVDDGVAADGSAFLVMELLQGKSVEKLVSKTCERMDLESVLSIACELLGVLAGAHAKGIIHRDIKPANLFITTDRKLKVLDFGIARFEEALGGTTTATGTALGTPGFMAPEQAAGKKSNRADSRTDIWATGATMFRLLTGEPVHECESLQDYLVTAATKSARPVQLLMPDLPRPIAHVIDKALAFNKGDRWGSAEEMREALSSASLETGNNCQSLPAVEPNEPTLEPPSLEFASTDSAPRRIGHGEGADGSTTVRDPDLLPSRGRTRLVMAAAPLGLLLLGAMVAATLARVRHPQVIATPAPTASASAVAPPLPAPQPSASDVPLVAPTPVDAKPDARMVHVPEATFLMGSRDGGMSKADEHPQHSVHVAAFDLDATEVTAGAYAACVDAHVCSPTMTGDFCNLGKPNRLDNPVNCTNFQQASVYCAWAGKRLPTEAEWEFAARGFDGRQYPWGSAVPDKSREKGVCWGRWGTLLGTCPVGEYPADTSPFGAMDMAGGVKEWTSSYYGSDYLHENRVLRAVRGGSWYFADASIIRAARRYAKNEIAQLPDLGFRCAR